MLQTSALYFARRVLSSGSHVRAATCLCWCGAADDAASEIGIDGHDGSIDANQR